MSGASYSLTTFSPTGKLLQIDYALNAVGRGRTSLGIKGESARAGCALPKAFVREQDLTPTRLARLNPQ